MIHVNDNHGDWDAHLPPGHGSIPWDQLFTELTHYQYRGALILELAGHGDELHGNVLHKAREARLYLRELAAKQQSLS